MPSGRFATPFDVSPSGYYDWLQRRDQPGPRAQEDHQLSQQVRQIHQASRQTYGAPRVQACLRQSGQHHGRNRITRLMHQQGLCGRQKRRFRVRTTESHHDQPVAPNRLAQAPQPERPNQVSAADITYVQRARAGFMSPPSWTFRRIVGWSVSYQINTALVLTALRMALCHRQPPAGLIFHSDRGVQYASLEYRQALALAEMIASMNRKANCSGVLASTSLFDAISVLFRFRFIK